SARMAARRWRAPSLHAAPGAQEIGQLVRGERHLDRARLLKELLGAVLGRGDANQVSLVVGEEPRGLAFQMENPADLPGSVSVHTLLLHHRRVTPAGYEGRGSASRRAPAPRCSSGLLRVVKCLSDCWM